MRNMTFTALVAILAGLVPFGISAEAASTFTLGPWSQAVVESGTDPDSASGFAPFAGGKIEALPRDGSRMIVMKAEFIVPEDLGGRSMAITTTPGSYPYEIYVDGALAGKAGDHEGNYASTIYHSLKVPIAPRKTGDSVSVTLVLHPRTETNPPPRLILGSWTAISGEAFLRNLLNIHLIQAAAVISLVIALFFFLLYAYSGAKDKSYLLFAFVCLSFALGYSNMSLFHEGASEVPLEKASRIGLPLTSLFLAYFAMSFTKFSLGGRRRDTVAVAIPAVLTGIAVVGTLIQPGKTEVAAFFQGYTTNFVLTPLLAVTIAMLVRGAIKRPGQRIFSILSAFVVTIGTSVHDIAWLSSDVAPFTWLVPYGYLTLVVAVFFALALDQASVLAKVNVQRRELNDQHDALTTVVRDLAGVSDGLVRSSAELEATVSETLSAIEAYGGANREIVSAFQDRSREVGQTIGSVSAHLETSSTRIAEAVGSQTMAVRAVSESLEDIRKRIADSLKSADESSRLAGELSKAAGEGASAMKKSREAIARVAERSKIIKEVLGTISDIVERTSVLSINAAIESARVGAAGKGFAVVAGEIRNLANQSGISLESSFERIKEMTDAIEESVAAGDAVDAAIAVIAERAGRSAGETEAMTRAIHAQGGASERISGNAERLLTETGTLERMSGEEKKAYADLTGKLDGIVSSFRQLSARIEKQGEMTDGIAKALERIRGVMAENSGHIERLKESSSLAQKAAGSESRG